MTLFRPCIDLHQGRVKQIVGGTLTGDAKALRTNFVASESAGTFARRYRQDGLVGGHVIQLGPGNEHAAIEALSEFPGGLQLGGGVQPSNARTWLDRGASRVIVTSWLFEGPQFSRERLQALNDVVLPGELVIDLSCRRKGTEWVVATERWQTLTDLTLNASTLEALAEHCAEFLIHAADVEGLCQGIDEELVQLLGQASPLPCTYAGGAHSIEDLERVAALSNDRVDLTFGSALDIFGGKLVRYEDCVAYNRRQNARS